MSRKALRYDEALAVIEALAPWDGSESLSLGDATGRVVASEALAMVDSPPFTNSAMDGIAVRHDDGAGEFRPSETILAAPRESMPEPQGTRPCVRIMTGAPLPSWADTVVPVEDCEALADGRVRVSPERWPARGTHVRQRGEDVRRGEVALGSGMIVTPERAMAATALGINEVCVRPRPRVWILSTGDELQEPGTPLRAGAIYNSSRSFLLGAARRCEVDIGGAVTLPDDMARARQIMEDIQGAGGRLFLTTGAVSAGEKDFIPVLAEEMGFKALFHKALIRPGRPVFLARRGDDIWLGLPGNPISTAVGWHFFVRPLLERLAGLPRVVKVSATLTHEMKKPEGLRCFYRGTYKEGQVELFPRQGSGEMRASILGNCYVELPEEGNRVAAGTSVLVTFVAS